MVTVCGPPARVGSTVLMSTSVCGYVAGGSSREYPTIETGCPSQAAEVTIRTTVPVAALTFETV